MKYLYSHFGPLPGSNGSSEYLPGLTVRVWFAPLVAQGNEASIGGGKSRELAPGDESDVRVHQPDLEGPAASYKGFHTLNQSPQDERFPHSGEHAFPMRTRTIELPDETFLML